MDYDVVVIGAGIHGAGVAQAAAAAGYRTLLLEQYPQAAAGTSSKSSKLIHGGLRYLESGQIGLVRECLTERNILLEVAPHLVRSADFHIPVYRQTKRRAWQIRIGLSLYALLGGKGFHSVPKTTWKQLDGLRLDDLHTVLRYTDAQTDDAALTRAVVKSAASLGATLAFGCSFEHAVLSKDRCSIVYREDDQEKQIQTRAVVNAGGPWVNEVLGLVEPVLTPLPIDLVAGTHLVIPRTLHKGMYYLEAPQDRRAVFVSPWKSHALLGTTETIFKGDPAEIRPLPEEIDYLLEVYNRYFEGPLDASAVIEAFAGLRVVLKSGESVFRRSRETVLHGDHKASPRMLSIYAGKLTSYRATGEKVIRKLARSLPDRERKADTRTLRLPA